MDQSATAIVETPGRAKNLPAPPKFEDPAQERRHRKERLAASFRLFARFGFDEGVAGHITVRDPEYHDKITKSEIYDGYRLIQGIQTPFSLTRMRNDENENQRFITGTRYNTGVQDSMFQPKGDAPKGKKK